jgi:hypothetical protein
VRSTPSPSRRRTRRSSHQRCYRSTHTSTRRRARIPLQVWHEMLRSTPEYPSASR